MDKKTTGIIATVVAALLCGCPGLFAVCFGAVMALAGLVPGAEIDVFGSSDPQAALITGVGSLCLGAIFVVIPIAVGFFTLRNQSASDAVIDYNEPIPPAN